MSRETMSMCDPEKVRRTYCFVGKPLVRDNNLIVRFQSRFDSSSLPIPIYNVACSITTAYPLAIRRKPDLTSKPCDGMAREPLFAVLSEGVRAINQNLIIKRLSGEIFL